MNKILKNLPENVLYNFAEYGFNIAKTHSCPVSFGLVDYYTDKCEEGLKDKQCEKCWSEALKKL